jgi:hypothetical protein
LMKCSSYEAPQYTALSNLLVQISSSAPCSKTSSV